MKHGELSGAEAAVLQRALDAMSALRVVLQEHDIYPALLANANKVYDALDAWCHPGPPREYIRMRGPDTRP